MIRRTYSKHRSTRVCDDDPPTKRRRVSPSCDRENLPPLASDSAAAEPTSDVLSEPPLALTATPPSSPPSTTASLPSSPAVTETAKKVLFPIFMQKQPRDGGCAGGGAFRSHSEPLRVISNNNAGARRLAKPRKLRQLTIDLGAPFARRCDLCGMEYTPSNSEDAALHKKFHAENVGGVDLRKPFLDSVKEENCVSNLGNGDVVVQIRTTDSLVKRRAAEKVLDLVERELGAIHISADELWSQTATKATPHDGESERFKTFLYIRGTKCVGFCLAQRIARAYPVMDAASLRSSHLAAKEDAEPPRSSQSSTTSQSSSISTLTDPQDAMMGISRIWVSNSARRKGIAATLLDSARKNFIFGIEVPRPQVAFSQPTESGSKLARKWFGEESGWLVYAD